MAIFRGSIRSLTLQMDTNLQVIVPYEYTLPEGQEKKTLILLHGLKQNADAWPRFTEVESFAINTGFNVVIPEGQRGFYADMKYGLPYFRYLTEELPEIIEKVFKIPADRDHLYAAGLSMGGYGAVKCALSRPDRFAGAMSYSGAFECIEEIEKHSSVFPPDEYRAVLGMDLKCPAEDDINLLAEKTSKCDKKPRLYIACGTEDSLIGANRRLQKKLKELNYDVTYEEWPGIHDWFFWNRSLARGMACMANMNISDVNLLDKEKIGSLSI